MMMQQVIWLLLSFTLLTTCRGSETNPKPDQVSAGSGGQSGSSGLQSSSAGVAGQLPPGPEARQATGPHRSSQPGPVFPYSAYQNSLYSNGGGIGGGGGFPQTPSSGGSMLSMLRPIQGGRRSSLTSRLRNLMSALFYRREQSTPYLGSASTYSYAFRQPPMNFGSSGLPSSPSSYFASESNRFPQVTFSGYPSASAASSNPVWSNYKQWSSSVGSSGGLGSLPASIASSLSSNSGGSNYAWSSNGAGSPGGSNSYSSGLSSSLGSFSGLGSSSSSSSGLNGYSSGNSYQAAASNSYPGAYASYSPNTSYQRSSVNYKPNSSSYSQALGSPSALSPSASNQYSTAIVAGSGGSSASSGSSSNVVSNGNSLSSGVSGSGSSSGQSNANRAISNYVN